MNDVAVLRRFNRSYTQRIGLLAESYLGTGRALGPSRLLFEIGKNGRRVGDLRRELALDSGYLSRLLRRLAEEGLVTLFQDPDDGRQRVVRLTAAGRREWARLDRRSEELACRLVGALSDRQRTELAGALVTAERLLKAATVVLERADPQSAAAQAALTEYFDELHARLPSGFDASSSASGDAAALSPPAGAFLLVRSDQLVIGCGGLQRIDETTGEIKRMWIHREWRGLGLGRRLLERLEAMADDVGYGRVVLDTNDSLAEAIAMYERAGYCQIERYNDNPYAQRWFAKDL